MKTIFVLFLLLSTIKLGHTQDDQFQKQVEEIMRAREEMLRSLLDDSTGSEMEKRMLEMMKRFGGSDFKGFSGGSDFGEPVGEYDWLTSDTQRILKIKVKQVKDQPLDIKIEKGMITIKGNVESGSKGFVQKMSFQRSFSIPKDVDQTNPEFENKEKEGELLIKFKRIAASASPPSSGKKIKTPPERTPVASGDEDLTI